MDLVGKTCKEKLEELGIRRLGQRVKICSGRHAGVVGVVECINWESAELRLEGLGRWFGPGFFLVLDPDYSVVERKVWEGPVNVVPRKSRVECVTDVVSVTKGFLPRRIK